MFSSSLSEPYMDVQEIPLKVTAARVVWSIKEFAGSGVGGRAKALFALLAGLLCAATVNSYVTRSFMTGIANRNSAEFASQAFLCIGVFAVSTVVAVTAKFAEERLGVLWREWLTQRVIQIYLGNGTYYRLSASRALANPDQRIAEDIKAFTVTTLSFCLMLLNSSFEIVAAPLCDCGFLR